MICQSCGREYGLPLPYDQCSPKSRDLCFDCLHESVRRFEEMMEVEEDAS